MPRPYGSDGALNGMKNMSAATSFYGAVEAGGTKFVCAIGDGLGNIHAEQRFATVDPSGTLASMQAFLRDRSREFGELAAIGVGSFGPIELDKSSPHYGHIGRTPKPGWSNTDIVGVLAREFLCPISFDTDVNAAALAEHRWGAAQDVNNLVYLTIGTGIGGGVIVNGALIHGLMHPEIGHLSPRRHLLDVGFRGVCPFHQDCLEGLASGPAILARTGSSLQELDPAHPQWDIEADYLGQLCAQLVLTLSPQRIVMGGGVMRQIRLLPAIRERLRHWLGGYVNRSEILAQTDRYIVSPKLGTQAGILGALALATDAAPAHGASFRA
jgi:fructokinase